MAGVNPKDVPTEFYNSKSFYTVGGSAVAVWIFCIVVSSVSPKDFLSPLHYRLIAILLSQVIAFGMVLKLQKRTAENWLLALFNGLLIFINASGWNVITTNDFFKDKMPSEKLSAFLGKEPKEHEGQVAAFFSFTKQIEWWQDNAEFHERKALQKENTKLKFEVNKLRTAVSNSDYEGAGRDSVTTIANRYDSVLTVLNKKEQEIAKLKHLQKATSNNEPSQISKPLTAPKDTVLAASEKLQLIATMRELMKNHETKMKICQSEISILQSKLNMINAQMNQRAGNPGSH